MCRLSFLFLGLFSVFKDLDDRALGDGTGKKLKTLPLLII